VDGLILVKPVDGPHGHHAPMACADTTIRIHPAEAGGATPAPACGGCVGATGGPSGATCRTVYGQPCLAPALQGDTAVLAQALQALRQVVDLESGGNLVDLHLVQSLHIQDGEADLRLTFPRSCGPSRLMAEEAFQVLRRLLPDTDVYVRLAG
jgi:metal-sulfur cluster biosynthetic enzyme